ncbi:unnamed protein product, partial [Meganyctiphanes norvegica]
PAWDTSVKVMQTWFQQFILLTPIQLLALIPALVCGALAYSSKRKSNDDNEESPQILSRPLQVAGVGERFFEIAQRHQTLITAYWLTLASAKPISEGLVRQALEHLYRKVPPLRKCLRLIDGLLWECEMTTENIDFMLMEDANPKQVFEQLLSESFNSELGPLWRARLIPSEAGSCPIPELQEKYPHNYNLLLSNHHGIADGTSNIKMCNLLNQILNDLVAGHTINDEEQLGEHVDETQGLQILNTIRKKLSENPERVKFLLDDEGIEVPPLIIIAYPPKGEKHPHTKCIPHEMDKETTQKLLKRCKQEGATLHSLFTAAIDGTLVDMALEAGVHENEYRLTINHFVNLRRYYQGDTSHILGCHVCVQKQNTMTPNKWRECIWNLAREIKQDLHSKLDNQGPLEAEVIRQMLMPNDEKAMLNIFEKPLPHTRDYQISNMGDLTRMFSGEGEHIQVVRQVRATTIQHYLEPQSHFLHTFRGKLMYCLNYDSNYLSEDVMVKLVNKLFITLKQIAEGEI